MRRIICEARQVVELGMTVEHHPSTPILNFDRRHKVLARACVRLLAREHRALVLGDDFPWRQVAPGKQPAKPHAAH
eukprot:6877243-Prymnesium_polylepis.1